MARVKGRNMSLREAMQEYLSNKNIKQVVFDYILPIYFVIRRWFLVTDVSVQPVVPIFFDLWSGNDSLFRNVEKYLPINAV